MPLLSNILRELFTLKDNAVATSFKHSHRELFTLKDNTVATSFKHSDRKLITLKDNTVITQFSCLFVFALKDNVASQFLVLKWFQLWQKCSF